MLQRLNELAQFRSTAFDRASKNHQLVGSIGRGGACADNAAMESFLVLLQKGDPFLDSP